MRNQALKRYHFNTAQKRNSYYDTALYELEEVLTTGNAVENEADIRELSKGINSFLGELDSLNRVIFIKRYYFGEGVNEISASLGKSPHFISVRLSRTREKLKKYLEKEDLL